MQPPKLIRFLIRHTLNGVVIGWCLLLAVLWTDALGLATMIARDSSGLLEPLMFLEVGLFAGVVNAGVAVMGLGPARDDEED